jgi:hypothetical protein
MKYNKGFAPLVVLLIVLGLVVVGGGAYMIGKSSSTEKEINPETLIQKENYGEASLPTNDSVAQKPSSECTTTSSPRITVLSPNGGETYKTNEKIVVKWDSCNIPKSHRLYIGLMPSGEFQGAPPTTVLSSSTLNDGAETFLLSGFSLSPNIYTVFISDNDLPNGTTNTWSKQFTISSISVSTTLPKYVGSFSICGDGSSLCWPPKITTSSQAYSCNNAGVAPNTEGNDVTTQKVIGGRTYCIHSQSSGYTGGRGYEYTYTTSNGAGTKIATFGINYVSCASYDDPAMSECKISQNAFKANLDALIDSLM